MGRIWTATGVCILSTLTVLFLMSCTADETADSTASKTKAKLKSKTNKKQSQSENSSLADLLNSIGGDSSASSNPFGVSGGEGSTGSLSSKELSSLQDLFSLLSQQEQEDLNGLLTESLDNCSFIGTYQPTAKTSCRNGNLQSCAATIKNYGVNYLRALLEDIGTSISSVSSALISDVPPLSSSLAACRSIDTSDPIEVQVELEKFRKTCVQERNVRGCLNLIVMAVKMFLQSILPKVLGKIGL